MPANIEVSEDGTKAAFWGKDNAWHGLGTYTPEAQNGADALRLAHLDWEVTAHPMQASILGPEGFQLVESKQVMQVRRNPFTGNLEELGVTGPGCEILQNSELGEWGEAVVDVSAEFYAGAALYHSAGALDDGRFVFMSMKVPSDLLIGGEDAIELFLTVINGHAGSRNAEILLSPVRVVCRNTYDAAVASQVARYKIRHTSGMRDRMEQAKKALGVTVKWMESLEAELTALLETPMSTGELTTVTDKLFGKTVIQAGSKGRALQAETIYTNRTNTLVDLFENAETNAFGRGTAYAGWNTITEYVDHFSVVQAGKDATEADREVIRTNKVLLGQTGAVKTKALSLLVPAPKILVGV